MDPFLSEIRLFTYGFPLSGWADCDGSTLPIQQNAALNSLLGQTFGGNGSTTFALPDMRGRVGICQGQQSGSQYYIRGQAGGSETVVLTTSQIANHNHQIVASADTTSLSTSNIGNFLGNAANAPADNNAPNQLYTTEYLPVTLRADAIGSAGGNVGHNNCMPSTALRFCIAIIGLYPPRD